MYDIKTRNSVLSLFGGIEVDKFPDGNFEFEMNSYDGDKIFKQDFPKTKFVCNLFNKVEKHIRSNDNYITRVVFKYTVIQQVEIANLKLLVNKLVEILGKDEARSGEFTEEDAKQFKNGYWMGRSWLNIAKNGVVLIIYRNNDFFELRLVFFQ